MHVRILAIPSPGENSIVFTRCRFGGPSVELKEPFGMVLSPLILITSVDISPNPDYASLSKTRVHYPNIIHRADWLPLINSGTRTVNMYNI